MNVSFLCLLSALLAGLASTLLELGWLRSAAAALPGTVPAAALVVPVFLVAWSLGSMVAGRLQDRSADRLALAARWLAASALATLGVPWVLDLLAGDAGATTPTVRVLLGGLPVAPAAFGLGGALPLFARLRAEQGQPPARATGAVAAAVALGGALGAWLWVPSFEQGWASESLAAGALAAAALWSFVLQFGASWPASADSANPVAAAPVEREPSGGVLDLGLAAFVGGALLVAGQLAMLRVLAQAEGDSIATTSQVLGGVHIGMALGAAWMAFPDRRVSPRALVALLLGLAGVSLLTPALLQAADGRSAWSTLPAALLFTVPLGVGAGSLVTAASRARARADTRLGSWVGDLAAWSTLGGVAGSLAYGTWLSPNPDVGTGGALQLMSLVGLACALLCGALALRSGGRRLATALVLLLIAGGATLSLKTTPYALPWRTEASESTLLRQLEGPYGVVSLVGTSAGETRLKLDNRFGLGGSAGTALERRMGRMAASFAPKAERALVLGLGRGHTLAALVETTAAEVDCVERNQQILDLELPLPLRPGMGVRAPTIEHADARAWVEEHPGTYDLIVGDLFFPWVTGAGDLLSREQFLALRRGLRPGGVVVQWMPLHQLPWRAFGSATRAFLEAFPTARLFVGTPLANRPVVALVGGMVEGLPDQALVDALLVAAPDQAGPNGMADLFDCYLSDAWALENRFRDIPVASRAWPLSELLSLDREDDEAFLAATNMRLVAEMIQPLDTSSLSRPPIDPPDNKRLGIELAARAGALRALLLARSARLSLDVHAMESEGGEVTDVVQDLDARLAGALLEGWRVFPGHIDLRRALVERARELLAQDRALDAGGLLEAALAIRSDAPLAGVLGSVFLALDLPQEAADMLDQVYFVMPKDPRVALDLGTAHLFLGDDRRAQVMLRKALELLGEAGLPQVQAVALGLLERQDGAAQAARAMLPELREHAAWTETYERLLAGQ